MSLLHSKLVQSLHSFLFLIPRSFARIHPIHAANASGNSNRSAIGVYRLPDDNGGLSEPAQIIFPNTTAVGPVTARQDRSYLHGVFPDPTRKFLLMTDLGQDRIRVFRYNQQTIAPLVELAPLVTPLGCGPRKAVFWTAPETGNLFLFVNGELDQRVYSYQVEYNEDGLEWRLVDDVVSISEYLPVTTAPTSEIAITVSSSSPILASCHANVVSPTARWSLRDCIKPRRFFPWFAYPQNQIQRYSVHLFCQRKWNVDAGAARTIWRLLAPPTHDQHGW